MTPQQIIIELNSLRYKLEKAWDTGMTVEDADIEAVADAIALIREVAQMGSMVCLCGKRYKDPINVYTQEKDPFWACLEKCQNPLNDRPSYEEVHKHNNTHTYVKGGMVWGK